mmetsp:Transcript_70702/g.165807  ORF Transcript_70702/g.165807 Transcript_70702/m.165807 type:complete len:91 (-) Transcript_70702:22-294(-)
MTGGISRPNQKSAPLLKALQTVEECGLWVAGGGNRGSAELRPNCSRRQAADETATFFHFSPIAQSVLPPTLLLVDARRMASPQTAGPWLL